MEESAMDMQQKMEQGVERQVTNWVTVAITIATSVIVTFVVAVIAFKLVWGWVVPDVFPGAVTQGLVVEDLSWLNAVKLAVLAAILGGFFPSLSQAFKQR